MNILLATLLASPVATYVTGWATEGPKPADVKAGWTAFVVFLLLLAAVALLGWSLSRQLKKAQRNKEAGILPSSKREPQPHAPQDQTPQDPTPQDHTPQT